MMGRGKRMAGQKSQEFSKRLIADIRWLLWAVTLGGLLLAATNIYHIHQWSQFDTVVVDSGEGSGNANYVQGDNTGGIYNGEGYGPAQEEGQVQGDQS